MKCLRCDGCGQVSAGSEAHAAVWYSFASIIRLGDDPGSSITRHACSADCFGALVGMYFSSDPGRIFRNAQAEADYQNGKNPKYRRGEERKKLGMKY